MGSSSFACVVTLSSVMILLFLQQPISASFDDLAPILPPRFNACHGIECGKGTCRESSNRTTPFVCECDRGWKRLHTDDDFPFLPCVVPDCDFDLSCTNSSSPAPSVPEHPTNHSVFDPCDWAYCGQGSCMKTAEFNHKCDCKEGYGNLLNITFFPCFSECALEGECKNMGIGLSNRSSASTTPNLSESSQNFASSKVPGNLLWTTILMTSMAIASWL
ncbi:uncharacterized protein [Aristolochia californica]|uniref:uncharacterized protein n=1 Tax=Aristolochia californica TaxID=171875 RepID=UPI0035E0BCBE